MADLHDFTPEEHQAMLKDHERKIDRDMIVRLEARGYIVRVKPEMYNINNSTLELITILETRGFKVTKIAEDEKK